MSSLFDRHRMPEWPLEAAVLWLSKEVCLVTPVGVYWQSQSHPSLSGGVRLPAEARSAEVELGFPISPAG